MNPSESAAVIEAACQMAAGTVGLAMATGHLPENVWAFIRPLPVWGRDDAVYVWVVISGPN